jgi:hypothetical protein
VKILKSQLLQLINEVTQGEMEFAELEAARQNFIENRGDDEAISDLLYKVEQLVEPLMNEMGLFFEAQELLVHGEIVFTNDRNMEVRIDPRGAMGRYDVQINPLHEAHDSFDPVEISLDSMKGVVQYIKDEFREELQRGGTYKQPPMGMVGEPEGQMELPLPRENKMRVTKSELQQIIKEEMAAELSEDKYATEDDRPLGTSRSLMSDKDARKALKMAELLYKEIGTTKIGAKISAAARAYASDLYAILEKGVKGPSYDGPVGSGPSADMEDYESDYRDPPSKPLDMSGGRKVSRAQRRREAEMMKDYDI